MERRQDSNSRWTFLGAAFPKSETIFLSDVISVHHSHHVNR